MKLFNSTFFKQHWPKFLSIFFFLLLFGSYMKIFAVFFPGEYLDPPCAPGIVGCTVSFSATETDPIFTASSSHAITNTNITNWNTAYGWGNHATAGYLTSYTETDPTISSWAKASTRPTYTSTDIGLGNVPNLSFSGTNSGDETQSSILTKLGIATLSGSNTGDNAVNSLYSGLAISKQDTLNGTGFVKSNAGVISYDNSTYLTTGTASSTYLPYTGGTSNLDLGLHNLTVDTNSLFVDSTNHRVGVGTVTPTTTLQVNGNVSVSNLNTTGSLPIVASDGSLAQDSGLNWSSGRPYLRDFQAKLANIMIGTANSQANILWLGDSLTGAGNLTGPLIKNLKNAFGDSGIGYVNFDSFYNQWSNISTTTGTWVDNNPSVTPGLNGLSTTSSDTVTPATKSITSLADSLFLYYAQKPGGGQFTWSVDGGIATMVDTSSASSSLGIVNIGTVIKGSHTVTVQVTSAGTTGVTIMGVDFRLSGSGVRLNTIGWAGAQAASYNNLNTTFWNAEVAQLGQINLITILLGGNEMSSNTAPTTYISNLTTLINRVKAIYPSADVLLISPVDNGLTGRTYTISQYVSVLQDFARINNYGFIDLYKQIGPFSQANSRGLFNADLLHPTAQGGRIMSDVVNSYLTSGMCLGNCQSNNSGSSQANTFWGNFSSINSVGNFNAGFGNNVLKNNITGSRNTAVGSFSLSTSIDSNDNTALGYQSLNLNTANSNTALGSLVLSTNTTGTGNSAAGASALSVNTTGSNNNAFGFNALVQNTTGSYNVGVGASALYGNTTGQYNIAVGGYGALSGNHTGQNNIALGSYALNVVDSSSNVAIGTEALRYITGSNNIALGYKAGEFIADGVTNNITSVNSVYLGYGTKANVNGATNETVIGYNAIGNGSNTVTFGNSVISYLGTSRNTAANTAGTALTFRSSGATLLSTDKNGGDLTLSS